MHNTSVVPGVTNLTGISSPTVSNLFVIPPPVPPASSNSKEPGSVDNSVELFDAKSLRKRIICEFKDENAMQAYVVFFQKLAKNPDMEKRFRLLFTYYPAFKFNIVSVENLTGEEDLKKITLPAQDDGDVFNIPDISKWAPEAFKAAFLGLFHIKTQEVTGRILDGIDNPVVFEVPAGTKEEKHLFNELNKGFKAMEKAIKETAGQLDELMSPFGAAYGWQLDVRDLQLEKNEDKKWIYIYPDQGMEMEIMSSSYRLSNNRHGLVTKPTNASAGILRLIKIHKESVTNANVTDKFRLLIHGFPLEIIKKFFPKAWQYYDERVKLALAEQKAIFHSTKYCKSTLQSDPSFWRYATTDKYRVTRKEAEQAFERRDYKKAKPLLLQLCAEGREKSTVDLRLSHIYYSEEEYDKAIPFFSRAIKREKLYRDSLALSKDFSNQVDLLWIRYEYGVSLLKAGHYKNSLKQFKIIQAVVEKFSKSIEKEDSELQERYQYLKSGAKRGLREAKQKSNPDHNHNNAQAEKLDEIPKNAM